MAENLNVSHDLTNEEDENEVVTLDDILQSERQQQEDADAVLGAADDKHCTYPEGYVKRQALYSCLTCIPEARNNPIKGAGVCLACNYHCHDGHELIELYTKRNFRCDCGNSKFQSNCNLEPIKTDLNEENVYNQNFSGTYCTCCRPYPDPDDSIPDKMIQCIICEDWLHLRHLGVDMPPMDSYFEMTCEKCIQKHSFLLNYEGLCLAIDQSEDVVVDEDYALVDNNAQPTFSNSGENSGDTLNKPHDCKMPNVKPGKATTKFWTDVSWRQQLCTCESCVKLYEEHTVSFLLDSQDCVQAYEEKGRAKALEYAQEEQDNYLKLLNSLDRVPLMETIAGYNDLKENLGQYLKKFADNKKVVRVEDIKEFFTEFSSRKRQRCEIPRNCR